MIGRIAIVDNFKEIESAEDKGLKIPKERIIFKQFLFDKNDVELAYITKRGNINMRILNEWFEIEFNEIIWNKLLTKFE